MVWAKARGGFTLIEVMVAVMIVSVVIGALFKLQGNSNYLLSKLQKEQKENDLTTLVLWSKKYGKEEDETNLYRLVEGFDIDDDLRQELKKKKVSISYKKLKSIDLEDLVLEIGVTEFSTKNFTTSLQRVTVQ